MQEIIMSFVEFVSSGGNTIQALLVLFLTLLTILLVLPFISRIAKFVTRKTNTDIDDKLTAALQAPVSYFVLLLGVAIMLPLLELPEVVSNILVPLVKTLFVLTVSQVLLRTIKITLEGAAQAPRIKAVNIQTVPLFSNVSFVIVGAAALYGIFLVWGIDVTAWLASAGILGIAIGFAAKDTLSNIISGAFILTDKPYSVGDFVVLGSGITGIVSDVGLRSTRIRTFDDEEVTIPNATIANEAITNKTTGPRTGRVKVSVGIAYGSDIKKAEDILLDIANAHELILKDPAPAVHFLDFGESSLDMLLSARVKDPLTVFQTKSDIRHIINERFAKSKIEIPFPQRDVTIKK